MSTTLLLQAWVVHYPLWDRRRSLFTYKEQDGKGQGRSSLEEKYLCPLDPQEDVCVLKEVGGGCQLVSVLSAWADPREGDTKIKG